MNIQRPHGQLDVTVTGSGPLVVCAPGMGDLQVSYRRLAPALVAAGCRVATMDLRGHGASDVTFDRYDPDAVGEDLLAVVDALGASSAVLVGNSAAGASAVWAAAERPDRVAGVVLLGPVVRDNPSFPAWAKRVMRAVFTSFVGVTLWRWFHGSLFKGGTPADHAAHADAVVASLRRPGRLAAAMDVGLSSKAACAVRVGDVQAPSLVVMGAADPDFPDARAEAAWLGDVLRTTPLVLDGVGHYPHLERADVTSTAVVAFLRRIGWVTESA